MGKNNNKNHIFSHVSAPPNSIYLHLSTPFVAWKKIPPHLRQSARRCIKRRRAPVVPHQAIIWLDCLWVKGKGRGGSLVRLHPSSPQKLGHWRNTETRFRKAVGAACCFMWFSFEHENLKGSSNIEKGQKRIWDCKTNGSGRGYALKEDHANPIFDRKETQKQQLLLQTLRTTFSCLLIKTHLESRNYNCLPSKPGIEIRQKNFPPRHDFVTSRATSKISLAGKKIFVA